MANDVTLSGPLFDGRATAAMAEGVTAARHALAQRGSELAVAAFTAAIQQNQGKFTHSVTVTDESRTYSTSGGRSTYTLQVDVPMDSSVVTTDIATYGPWLEGTGSRNETTRFKGYSGFRIASQELDSAAGGIADGVITPYVARCN